MGTTSAGYVNVSIENLYTFISDETAVDAIVTEILSRNSLKSLVFLAPTGCWLDWLHAENYIYPACTLVLTGYG